MRVTKVTGLPVVDTHVARQAGVVADVLLDMKAGRLALLNVNHGDGWLVQRIPADYVYRLGPRTVMVSDTVAVDLDAPSAHQPWFPIRALVGLEVMTDGGDRVGQIVDAEIDEHTLAVSAYVLRNASGAWRWRGRVYPDEVVACSPELMLIRDRKK